MKDESLITSTVVVELYFVSYPGTVHVIKLSLGTFTCSSIHVRAVLSYFQV